jgi:eukaryotic-like serine/threonine-protein kinase
MQNDPLPSKGLIAGKYELVGLIGRGGMGSVWEGRHTSLNTRVAIKFIESDYANSQEARTRFDNEARAAARIQSKHAIQIFDHGMTDDGKPYIVMEYLAGEPLDKRLERVHRISIQETARILQQVCRALTRAHELGIIHRDLKPENIFLVRSPDDDDEIAKVLDFGIAKIKGPPGSTSGIGSGTKTGAVLGTPFFMSPEQARGLRNVDHRTDVWSLGIIAFKCVTGILPFEGESIGDLLVKICTAPVPVPSQHLPGLPPSFDAWFARALEREPERRFATTAELSDALAFCAGVSVRRPASGAGGPNAAYVPTAALPSGGVAVPAQAPHQTFTPQGRAPDAHAVAGSYPYGQVPSATSAPFTASATRVPSSGRGVIVGSSIAAALVVGSLGFIAVTKLAPKHPAATDHETKPIAASINAPTASASASASSVVENEVGDGGAEAGALATTPGTTPAKPNRPSAPVPSHAATRPAAPSPIPPIPLIPARSATVGPVAPPPSQPNKDPGW